MTAPDDVPTQDLTPVPPGPPRTVEAKLVVSTTLATVLYMICSAVQANTAVLDPLPPWARSLVLALLPGLLGFAAGWRVPSNRV